MADVLGQREDADRAFLEEVLYETGFALVGRALKDFHETDHGYDAVGILIDQPGRFGPPP
jgi:hypothetical protein